MNIRIRQIYYSPVQYGMLEEDFEPYYSPDSDKFLESGVIAKLYQQKDHLGSDYYGVFSWKFRQKNAYTGSMIRHLVSQNEEFDAFSFFKKEEEKLQNKNMWIQGDNWHPLFTEVGKRIFEKLGIEDVTKIETRCVYQNAWIAKREVFESYCKELLVPVIDLINQDPEIGSLCNSNAHYRTRDKISKERCMKLFGRPYFTYHPFITERLFGTYCGMKNLKLKHL